jgi:DnaK suppressor protein
MLTTRNKEELGRVLRRSRQAIFTHVTGAEADLRLVTEDRESELEERAGEESAANLLARLDERGTQELATIDAALRRLVEGTYGLCTHCRKPIPLARLEATPAVPHCTRCTRQAERASGNPPRSEEPASTRPQLPPDLDLLSDSELAETVRELVRDDGRVDMEELRISCRHGVVYMTGTLPSEAERQIVRKLLTDVEGLREIVDRVRVNELSWERDDRVELPAPFPDDVSRELFEATRTEDPVRADEEGIPYEPPDEPPPDEE